MHADVQRASLSRPAATRVIGSRVDTGSSHATGRPRLVISSASPRSTLARTPAVLRLSSRTGIRFTGPPWHDTRERGKGLEGRGW